MMPMNVLNLSALTHAKPITLAVSTSSAEVGIDAHARYVITATVGIFIRIAAETGHVATAADVYIPANVPTLLPNTGMEFFIALGLGSGFVQLVKNG